LKGVNFGASRGKKEGRFDIRQLVYYGAKTLNPKPKLQNRPPIIRFASVDIVRLSNATVERIQPSFRQACNLKGVHDGNGAASDGGRHPSAGLSRPLRKETEETTRRRRTDGAAHDTSEYDKPKPQTKIAKMLACFPQG